MGCVSTHSFNNFQGGSCLRRLQTAESQILGVGKAEPESREA